MTIQEIFEGMKATFAERNKTYGDSYRQTGVVLQALFPKGLTLETIDEWQRFGAFFMIICKAVRYAEQMKTGGHIDSAHDSAVYSAILEELTREAQPVAKAKIDLEDYSKTKYIIIFKPESKMGKYYTTRLSPHDERTVLEEAKTFYGESVHYVQAAHHVKIATVYHLKEVPFGERIDE